MRRHIKHEKYAIIDAFLIFFSRVLFSVVKLTLNAIFARERLLCYALRIRGAKKKGLEGELKGRRAK